jgi:thiamine transport system permease protein
MTRSVRAVELAVLGGIVAFLVAFALLPAAELFARGFSSSGGLSALGTALASAGGGRAFSASVEQGALSAALAGLLGYPAGIFLGRYRWPGREVARSALLLPFLLPGLVMVLGVLDLLGPTGLVGGPVSAVRWFASGVPGIVAVNLLYNVPIVVVLTAAGCEASSSDLEETVACLGGSPARVYRETWALPSGVGAACGALLTFVLSALSFAPPILLCGERCATVEVRVYELAAITGAPGLAGLLAVLLVAAFAGPAVVYVLLARRLRAAGGRGFRPLTVAWGRPSTWLTAGAFAAMAVVELALLGAVVLRSLAPPGGGPIGRPWALLFAASTTARLGAPVGDAVLNTLAFAALAAAVTIVLGIGSAFLTSRVPSAGTPLSLLLFVPILISPIVLAEALGSFWGPFLGTGYAVAILIVLSQALLAMPFAVQSLEIPLAGVPRRAAESAAALGAGPWGAFVDGELPRIRRGVETAVLFAFALGLGEFTATYFFANPTPAIRTLPVEIFLLVPARLFSEAEAAAALLLLLSLVVFAAIILLGGRDER